MSTATTPIPNALVEFLLPHTAEQYAAFGKTTFAIIQKGTPSFGIQAVNPVPPNDWPALRWGTSPDWGMLWDLQNDHYVLTSVKENSNLAGEARLDMYLFGITGLRRILTAARLSGEDLWSEANQQNLVSKFPRSGLQIKREPSLTLVSNFHGHIFKMFKVPHNE